SLVCLTSWGCWARVLSGNALAVVTDPTMRPAPVRHNRAVLPHDRTGRSDGEASAVDGQRGAVDVVGVLARQVDGGRLRSHPARPPASRIIARSPPCFRGHN